MAKQKASNEKYYLQRDGQFVLWDGEESSIQMNDLIWKETKRPDGSIRLQQDYSYCTSMTDQSQAHMTDLNVLIKKFKPDELAAYIAARTGYRQEILGHDFSIEPSLQEARNVVYAAKKIYDELPEEIQRQFRTPLEFVKFIDNPANAEKMLKMGLLKPKQVEALQPKASMENNAALASDDKDARSKDKKE